MDSQTDAAYRKVADIARSGQELLQSQYRVNADIARTYLQWYEKVEVMIKDFLEAVGQTVNTVRDPFTGNHNHHEEVLKCLRNPKNPYHDILGCGETHQCLRYAKGIRNSVKSRYLQPGNHPKPRWDRWTECIERIGNAMFMALGVMISEVKHRRASDLRFRAAHPTNQENQLLEAKQRIRQCELELEELSAQMENDIESLNERKSDKAAQAREHWGLRLSRGNLEIQSFEILFDHQRTYLDTVNNMKSIFGNRKPEEIETRWLEGEGDIGVKVADELIKDLSKFMEWNAAATQKVASLDWEARDLNERLLQVQTEKDDIRDDAMFAQRQLVKQDEVFRGLRRAGQRLEIETMGPRARSRMEDYILDTGKKFLTTGPQSDKLREVLMGLEETYFDQEENSFGHHGWAKLLLLWTNAIIEAIVS